MAKASIPGVAFRRRMFTTLVVSCLCFLALITRHGWIVFAQGEWLRGLANDMRTRDIPVEAKRGVIYDRGHYPLAISINVDSVYAQPAMVDDPPQVAALLSQVLDLDYETVLAKLVQPQGFVYIKRKITPEQSVVIKELIREGRLPGIETTQEGKRLYPSGVLAAHLVGIAGIDSQGLEGLELQYDEYLRGTPGRIEAEVDSLGEAILGSAHQYIPAQDGASVYTTIDETIQSIARRGILRAQEQTQAARVGIIVMDVKTGGILALAQTPEYDPNDYEAYPDANRRNWLIADGLEPGSMFKPIVAAAAMEEGLIDRNTPFNAPGSMQVANYTISNWNFAPVSGTLIDIVAHSSNTGFVQIGWMLGIDKFYEYVEKFGFLGPTGLDLPGEATSQFPPKEKATQLDLAVMSFGQTFTATPLQVVRAMAAIANDGKLMKPYLVSEIRSADGEVIYKAEPQIVQQVISPEVARELADMMEKVISEGTGKNAYVPGYKVAGKTGTAEKLPRGSGKYIADFLGFAPADDPRLAVVIVIDEPVGVYYGGQIAAPVFRDIMGDLLRYLEIPPELPLDIGPGDPQEPVERQEVAVPELAGLTIADAQATVEALGLRLRVEGQGSTVLRQLPPPGTVVPEGTQVLVETEARPEGQFLVPVPDVSGHTMAEVSRMLAESGLKGELSGTGLAVQQSPEPWSLVAPGSTVHVLFAPP